MSIVCILKNTKNIAFLKLTFFLFSYEMVWDIHSVGSLEKVNLNHYVLIEVEVEVEVNLLPTVSRPAFLGVRLPSGTRDQFFFLLEIFFRQLRVCYFVAPSLTIGRVCNLLYNCKRALLEQSL
jgi:hypothetical protein